MTDLRTRLQALADRVPLPQDAWDRFDRRRHQDDRRRRLGVAAVALVVAGGGIAVAASALLAPSASRRPSITSTPGPSVRPSSSWVPPVDTARTLTTLPGPVDALASDGPTLYAAYALPGEGDVAAFAHVIARVDPATGALLATSPPLDGRVQLAVSGPFLWAAVRHGHTPLALAKLDPTRLTVLDRIELAADHVAAGPTGLWVAAGQSLSLLEPATSQVVRSVALDGGVSAMTVDPSARLLYVATHGPGGDPTPRSLYELDARTGEIIVQAAGPAGLAVNAVSAAPDGVWVSYPNGMIGIVALHGSGDLRPRRVRARSGGNAITASVVGGVLWIFDGLKMTCHDPNRGRFRADVLFPPSVADNEISKDVMTAGNAIVVGTGNGLILRIGPSPACSA